MSTPEIVQTELARARIEDTLRDIATTPDTRMGVVARFTLDRLKTNGFSFQFSKDRKVPLAAATKFGMASENRGETIPYKPTLLVNPDRTLTLSEIELMADIARSAAVAYQYSENGYTDNLRNIYTRAVEEQRNFLEDINAPVVASEPRGQDAVLIAKTFLDDREYKYGIGILETTLAAQEAGIPMEKIEEFLDSISGVVFSRAREVILDCIDPYTWGVLERHDKRDPGFGIRSVGTEIFSFYFSKRHTPILQNS